MGLIWGPKAIEAQPCICNTLAFTVRSLLIVVVVFPKSLNTRFSFRFSFALLQFRFPSQSKIMGVTKEDVEASLTSKMNPTHLEVIDTSGGCGASFAIEIVSEQFEGKRLLERHRMVNTALVEEMKNIHALSIKKALTPTQWSQQQESNNTQSAS